MSKWEKVRLGDVAAVISGSTPRTNEPSYWDGDINWVTPAEIDDDTVFVYETQRKITEKAVLEGSMRLIPEGTVLLTSRAPIGKAAIAGTDMYCNQGFKNLLCSDEIHNKYLYWFLKGKSDYLNSLGRGATFKEISKAIVEDIQVPLPAKEVQIQIAREFDAVSELMALHKHQLEELDQLIKSVFYEMFGDPAVNEKGWEKGAIGDLAKNINYGTSQKASTEPEGIPILRMNNITYEGTMDYTDLKYIVLSEKDKKKYLVHKGELLFNRTNSKELVGKTAVYKRDEPMAFAGYLIRLVPNERANSEYISGYLNSKHGKRILYGMAKNIIGMANINAKEFASIPIPIPPISLQNKYADIVSEIEEQKSLVKQAIDETQHLFDSLMSKYFDD